VQTGLCAAVAILATRRWAPNATIVAWLGAGVDATSMLQPLLSICLAGLDALS
jgi:ornithine cyclodeaminase/alanine dehydrogenase-like protein (mu-crystallin family)